MTPRFRHSVKIVPLLFASACAGSPPAPEPKSPDLPKDTPGWTEADRSAFCFYFAAGKNKDNSICAPTHEGCERLRKKMQEAFDHGPASGHLRTDQCLPVAMRPVYCFTAKVKGHDAQPCTLSNDMCLFIQEHFDEHGYKADIPCSPQQ